MLARIEPISTRASPGCSSSSRSSRSPPTPPMPRTAAPRRCISRRISRPSTFAAEVHPTDGHPVVFAKSPPAGGDDRRRVLFYGHYDVQPVDPLDLWQTPPFEPRIATLPDGRKAIVARGACDDKGQVMTFIEACRAWKAVTGTLPLDVTFLIEGEEECGSKHLPPWVEAHRGELGGRRRPRLRHRHVGPEDAGDHHGAARPPLRGDQDQGAPTATCIPGCSAAPPKIPIRVLAKIIAAIHDHDGRITIPGFYDGVKELPDAVKKEWQDLGLTPEKFLGQVGLERSRRREGPPRHRADFVASDLRRQRHLGRLYRPRREDRDPRRGLRQDLVPPGRRPEAGEDPRGVPRLRARRACRPTARSSSSAATTARRRSRSTGTCRSSPRRARR